MIQRLQHPEFTVRWAAIVRLVEIGPPATPFLIEALGSPGVLVRVCAARTLGELKAVEAIPALRLLLEDPACAHVAQTALQRLERLPPLPASAPEPEPPVPAPKVPPRALTLGDTDFLPQFREQDRRERLDLQLQIAHRIGELGDRRSYKKRIDAVEALVKIGPDALHSLLDALDSPGVLTRTRAADTLGRLGLPEAIPRLLHAYKSARDANQQHAISQSLLQLAEKMTESPAPAHLELCLLLLRERGITNLPASLSVFAARTLEQLARTNPTPELRSALPWLKGVRPFVPREFLDARNAIESAINLPIAADAPDLSPENLPRPMLGE